MIIHNLVNIDELRSEYFSTPDGFKKWIAFLDARDQPHLYLSEFSRNYYYFSVHQIQIFANIIYVIDPYDTDTLCEIAKVLYEELGQGNKRRVHSEMMKRFALYCGTHSEELPTEPQFVAPGVNIYLDTLRDIFSSRDLNRAIAGYLFLEETAVSCYAPIVSLFKSKKYPEASYEFFLEHSVIEVEHMELAEALVRRSIVDTKAKQNFMSDLEKLKVAWESMWNDLNNVTQEVRG